jgi:hypothetical protein
MTTRAEGRSSVKPFDSLRLPVPTTSQTIAAINVSQGFIILSKRLLVQIDFHRNQRRFKHRPDG